ncbi:L,D-transpeptidase [Limosilactobacillus panis]|uniref:L,D-transpeptidase n=1 Tax=Limosilactobacillus panis TaxID=47493 RepID=UPI001C960294|nr:L,D-transpeptidase [Limosilactobacillus panis]QZN92999.1 L,D-transpeptidase [Limosilactobacillus panis]UUF81098.1 L,D-transpeptidase [Xanthomonas oryzae pv. oryzae]
MQKLSLKKVITGILVVLLVLLLGVHLHQRNHFNRNVTVNHVAVGGLTAQQAYDKVKKAKQTSKIYVKNQLVYVGKPTRSGFTASDKGRIIKALHEQYTFFPSRRRVNLLVEPANLDKSALGDIDAAVNNQIQQLNRGRRAPHDAYAVYQDGKVKVIPAVKGTQYSSKGLTKTVSREFVNGTVHLQPKFITPLSANSATVQNEKKQLTKLEGRSVTYRVQNKDYRFTTAGVIARATYQNGHYSFKTRPVKAKINQINRKQATLGKSFRFKTTSGKAITTTNTGTYGWKISSKQAGQSLASALVANKKQVNAANDIYGKGYSHLGTGYNNTSNDGIGKTYVAVSLAKQHAWFYKNGKCVLSTDIVSGTNNAGNRTPKGVWYIMYQQSPSVLRGTNDNGSKYSSPVQYWSPFTLSGCGFHDASWRHDWSKTAYKETGGGSHGCINMHPENAGIGSHALSKGEPVIIY